MLKKTFFTLIEVLVICSILLILTTLLQPSLKKIVQSANLALCENNYRQIFTSIQLYLNDHNKYPVCMTNPNGSDRGRITWDDLLGLEYDGRNLSLSIADKMNLTAEEAGKPTIVQSYFCPEDTYRDKDSNQIERSYALNINQYYSYKEGISNAWKNGTRWSASVNEIYNPRETILLTELHRGYIGNINASGIHSPKMQNPENGNHLGEFNYLFADGHCNTYFPIETFNPTMNISTAGKFWTRDPDD